MSNQHYAAGLVLALLVVGGLCMATERPTYSVEINDPPYEVRNYDPTIIAMVHADGGRREAVSSGFRILANYIFGNNRAKDKIAMTAPVGQQSATTGWDVSFTMPAGYTLSTLPAPNDPRVKRVEVPRHRVAVITFSGLWSDANLKSHESELLQWIKTHQLVAAGPPTYAYYDPPWTPWFLRTIEVMVEIQ